MKHMGELGKKSGLLLRNLSGGRPIFREYTEDGGFIDYKILHSDLSIIVDETDAHVYESNGEMIIDHAPETLGIEKE